MKAVLIVSHGSHSPKTKQEVVMLLQTLKKKAKADIYEYAFLEIEKPSIPEGIEKCVIAGGTEIIVLLNFLNSGKHVDTDIPEIVRQAQLRYPKIKFRMTSPVGQHPRIVDLFAEMIT